MPNTNKNILLAEDKAQFRKLIANTLPGNSYNVLEAVDAEDTIQVTTEHSHDNIDLLLTDVVMPHITGTEVAKKFKTIFPKAGIILMSAYAKETIIQEIESDQRVQFIEKPFLPQVLTEKVGNLLN